MARTGRVVMFVLKLLLFAIVAAIGVGVVIRLLNPLPALEPRIPSHVLDGTGDTPIGRFVERAAGRRPGLSGVHLLSDPHDAFAARIALARAATRSLDVQYYIWKGDISGKLMIEEMRAAADRGVRVRMLLDDNGVPGLDPVLASLDSHPNIEVRLYNPFVLRWPKMAGYLADFSRLNRRMHNKSFTADNQATVIGGRNIGDEYFAASDGDFFADLDVIAIGPAVASVSGDFDRYWNSQSAYPAERILPALSGQAGAALLDALKAGNRGTAAQEYQSAIGKAGFQTALESGQLEFDWAPVKMVSDDPAKTVGKADKSELLTTRLTAIIGAPARQLSLISGYFVPGAAGVDAFARMRARGADVRVVTNSFDSTDVWIVHAGYAKRREALLRAGVRLFEMRSGRDIGDRNRKLLGAGSGSGQGSDNGQVLRASASMLHAKTFTVDNDRVFVGSFNFDPRSFVLNTELGFVIESRTIAAHMQSRLDAMLAEGSYQLVLTPAGAINWIERRDGRTIVHSQEPATSRAQRVGIGMLSWLPIEWLL